MFSERELNRAAETKIECIFVYHKSARFLSSLLTKPHFA